MIDTEVTKATFVQDKSRQCKKCEKTFEPKSNNQRFCSPECRPEYRQFLRTVKVCDQCGKEFQGKKSEKRCSEECKAQHKVERISKYYTPVERSERNCRMCGKIFTGKKSHNYCSNECRLKGYKQGKHRKPSKVETDLLENDITPT